MKHRVKDVCSKPSLVFLSTCSGYFVQGVCLCVCVSKWRGADRLSSGSTNITTQLSRDLRLTVWNCFGRLWFLLTYPEKWYPYPVAFLLNPQKAPSKTHNQNRRFSKWGTNKMWFPNAVVSVSSPTFKIGHRSNTNNHNHISVQGSFHLVVFWQGSVKAWFWSYML